MLGKHLREFYESTSWKDSALCWYPFEESVSYETIVDPSDFTVGALVTVREKLGAHGRLLLAYENPFALRFWAGKRVTPESEPYDTLFGYGRNPMPSKAELMQRLTLAGFNGQKWYYPLTDHYFTSEVYSDAYLPDEFMNQRFTPYVEADESLRFDERLLYREVIRNGAFPFLCGAYIVEARVCADDTPCPVDYAAVTAYREPTKRFATTVRNDGTVRKTALHPDGAEGLARTLRNHRELARFGVDVLEMWLEGDALVMPRVARPTLWDYWARKLADGSFDEDEMFAQYDRIRDSIMLAAQDGKCFWEMVPANCFFDAEADRIIFFDQEYAWDNVPPEVALARAIWAIPFSASFRADSRSAGWMKKLKTRYGLAARWEEFSARAGTDTYTEVFGKTHRTLHSETERATAGLAGNASDHQRQQRFMPVVQALQKLGLRHPAVYGCGIRGKSLLHVLCKSGVRTASVIDREAGPMKSIAELPPGGICDCIIVSVKDGDAIAAELRTQTDLPVYTLEELLNGEIE